MFTLFKYLSQYLDFWSKTPASKRQYSVLLKRQKDGDVIVKEQHFRKN